MNIKRWIFIFFLVISNQLFTQNTDAGPCSDPKVKMTFELSMAEKNEFGFSHIVVLEDLQAIR
jgi:hypothetical protein